MTDATRHVTIRRERGFFGVLRKLVVQVDGSELMRIKSGESKAVKLPVSLRQMTLRMDWVVTTPFDLADVQNGDTLVIYVLPRSFAQMSGLKEIPFGIRIERP